MCDFCSKAIRFDCLWTTRRMIVSGALFAGIMVCSASLSHSSASVLLALDVAKLICARVQLANEPSTQGIAPVEPTQLHS